MNDKEFFEAVYLLNNDCHSRILDVVNTNHHTFSQEALNCTATIDANYISKYYDLISQMHYAPTMNELPKEKDKMKIDPKKFRYHGYLNQYSTPISEEEARTQMTGYRYRTLDPLLISEIDERYWMPGPSDTEPFKQKMYNRFDWYANYYDGKHGQKKEISVVNQYDLTEQVWQDLVVAMVVSGDYTLREALYIVAVACDRCRNALLYKYKDLHNHENGYSEDSDEYQRNRHRCEFCSGY